MVKNPPANAGNTGDMDSIPGSGRFRGYGNGNPLQHSCLKNPMDRGACRASVDYSPWITKSGTGLSHLHFHTFMGINVSCDHSFTVVIAQHNGKLPNKPQSSGACKLDLSLTRDFLHGLKRASLVAQQ